MKLDIPVVDMHCDVLYKMQLEPSLEFLNDSKLDVTISRLQEGKVALQTFAIYLSERLGTPRFEHVYKQLEIYDSLIEQKSYTEGLRPLRWKQDAEELRNFIYQEEWKQRNQIWSLLSLEGVDGLEGNLSYLDLIYEKGVRFIGVTWNYANWAADGILEERNGGFTNKGKALIKKCNDIGLIIDVSHLSEAGFWELTDMSEQPVIASHSNVKSICPNPRNLTDNQIRAIITLNGRIGMTFVPWFVKKEGKVTKADLLKHIDHVCALGGADHIMFGSDFDGIPQWIEGLEHPGKYPDLVELLQKHYPETLVRQFMYDNMLSFLCENLKGKP
ncbi:dipeptidase [Paenibacillus gallinarum]|uniref:Dipeptidase n=1 Tax=Paenibacillus gallinarum TaxID=2762232 RepID=A0ABR8SUW7_9BACL|nr:dipeptidase [Paenibacillus gallinarum]MBD7967296.1 dipeptidase [Paenibacillus gallinarum]